MCCSSRLYSLDLPQNSFCTSAEFFISGFVKKQNTATRRSFTPWHLLTRCKHLLPCKLTLYYKFLLQSPSKNLNSVHTKWYHYYEIRSACAYYFFLPGIGWVFLVQTLISSRGVHFFHPPEIPLGKSGPFLAVIFFVYQVSDPHVLSSLFPYHDVPLVPDDWGVVEVSAAAIRPLQHESGGEGRLVEVKRVLPTGPEYVDWAVMENGRQKNRREREARAILTPSYSRSCPRRILCRGMLFRFSLLGTHARKGNVGCCDKKLAIERQIYTKGVWLRLCIAFCISLTEVAPWLFAKTQFVNILVNLCPHHAPKGSADR